MWMGWLLEWEPGKGGQQMGGGGDISDGGKREKQEELVQYVLCFSL